MGKYRDFEHLILDRTEGYDVYDIFRPMAGAFHLQKIGDQVHALLVGSSTAVTYSLYSSNVLNYITHIST
jgi:hypothetical protein